MPGKCFYPPGVTQHELDAFVAAHPEEQATVMGARTIVRRADYSALSRDLAALRRYPVLDVLHPELGDHLRALARTRPAHAFYAVPYPVAYPDSFLAVYRLLRRAATAVAPEDAEFAGYLHARARDLLANDYEAGDASWVTGRFRHLNAQIGAYETYEDELLGVKASHALSLMIADSARSAKVREATRGLQDFENSLPIATHKRVKEDLPVGVYDVIADFGQARGGNTATILPNESLYARRYGRTILLRRNIMTDPGITARARRTWEAAVAAPHRGDWSADGSFQRTLWHELGHYLGVDRDRRGRDLDPVLLELSGTLEEMKADLVSLYLAPALRKRGYYSDRDVRTLYGAGVLRMLLKNRPRPDETYGVMQLMQMNWFLDKGALTFDPAGKLVIHWERYPAAVSSLLGQVLELQWNGDHGAARRFVDRWTTWDDRHVRLAAAMKAAETSRFTLVHYAALGE